MTNLHFVYCVCPTKEEAKLIAKQCVSERLAACSNIIDGMESMYWWEGELIESTEVVLIFKTTDKMSLKLFERIKKMHSYQTPSIISLPILAAELDYQNWIRSEVNKNLLIS